MPDLVYTYVSNSLIQYCAALTTGWTIAPALRNNPQVRRDFHIDKLNDEFGQYSLDITCGACGHKRTAGPHTLAKLCGWDARLEDVAKRMRCSKCGKKQCTLRATELVKPRGYSSLPR